MTRTNQIKSSEWQSTLNLVSQKLTDRTVNIEVIGMDIGDQIEARSVHLKGLTYDPREKQIEISSDDFAHTIQAPSKMYFTSEEESIESIQSIEFVDGDSRKHIVTFDAPLLLSR